MNKLETINESISEIREILGAECAHISELPDLIRGLNTSGAGYTTAFVFSSVPNPIVPTAKTIDLSTGLVNDLNSEWSQTGFTTGVSTFSLRSSNIADANWMTFAIFDPQGNIKTDGADPVNLKGVPGADGLPGSAGAKGDKGDTGEKGDPGEGTSYEFIYLRTASIEPNPITPDSENVDGQLPITTDGQWTAKPQGVDDDNIVEGVCQRKKVVGGSGGDWSTPAIGAQGGKIGRDGNGIEYIFCLTKDETTIPDVPYSDPSKGEVDIQFPLKSNLGYEGTDDPGSVTKDKTVCWISTRKQKYTNSTSQEGSSYSPPAIWSKYSKDGENGIDGGGRSVFAYCAADKGVTILTPYGGSGDPKTNKATPPIKNENQAENITGFTSPPDVTDKQVIGLSCASFNGNGIILGDGWSTPFRITGDDGVNGSDGNSVEFIYRLFPNKENFKILQNYHNTSGKILESDPDNSEVVPTKIDIEDSYREGWNLVEIDGVKKYTICDTEWTDEPKGIDGVKSFVEAACTRRMETVLDEDGNPVLGVNGKPSKAGGPGSLPFPWAVWGEDGIDGTGVEYIFLVTPKYDNDGEEIGVTYDEDGNIFIHPMLRIPTYEYYQKYDETYLTEYAKKYQESEFLPGTSDDNIANTSIWTDEPQDVDPSQPVEWVAIRRRTISDDGKTGTWGDFSIPKKWNNGAADGSSFKTSFAFAKSSHLLNNILVDEENECLITGGDFDHPEPNPTTVTLSTGKEVTITGYDGVPEGATADTLWMTQRTFKAGDEENEFGGKWSIPSKMSDSSLFQVEFSKGYGNEDTGYDEDIEPSPLDFHYYYKQAIDANGQSDLEKAESNWRVAERNKGWVGGDAVTNAVWMITTTFNGGEWSEGTVTRVKGEKGDAGKNGTSVTIKGSAVLDDCDFNPNVRQQLASGDNAVYVLKICNQNQTLGKGDTEQSLYIEIPDEEYINGDGYLINGDLGVWDGDSFENVGQIQGPAGESTNLYLAFSDDIRVIENNEVIQLDLSLKYGKYIGYCISEHALSETALLLSSTYNGYSWSGDDGGGYEQIFLLTKEVHTDDITIDYDNGPEVPHRVTDDDGKYIDEDAGFLPNIATKYVDYAQGLDGKGMDRPATPNSTYPFCGVVGRNTSDYIGKGDTNDRAVLYSRYVPTNIHLELSQDCLTLPVDPNTSKIDDGFEETIELYLYNGDSEITGDNYYYHLGDGVGNSCSKVFSTKDANLDEASIIYFKAVLNENEFYKNCSLIKLNEAYEIIPSKTVLRANSSGFLVDPTLDVTVKKGDFNTNVGQTVSDKIVFISIYKEGEDVVKQELSKTSLKEYSEIEHITVFITDDNTIEGNTISFEDIGVVTDGEAGKSAVHLELSEDNVTVPLETDGTIDPDFKEIDITAYVYSGETSVPNNLVVYSYSLDGGEWVSIDNSELEQVIVITAEELSAKPSKLSICAKYNDAEYKKDCKINYSSIGYEMNVSKHIVRRDVSNNSIVESDREIIVKVTRGYKDEWLPVKDCTIAGKGTQIDGTEQTYLALDTDEYGSATFTIGTSSEFLGLSSLMFTLGYNDSVICFEEVGVIANGEDGGYQEFIYARNNTGSTPTSPNEYQDKIYDGKSYQDAEGCPTTEGWYDDPKGVTKTLMYEFVSTRKKKDGTWEDFSNPVLGAKYGADGIPGENGESALVSQLSNPSAIIQYSGGKFLQEDASTSLQVMYGTSFIPVESISFTTYLDGVQNNNVVTLIKDLNTGTDYTSNLSFTITDSLSIDSHRIVIELAIVVNINNESKTLYETMTIVVQTAGGESVSSVDLENEFIQVSPFKIATTPWSDLSVSSNIHAWYGSLECTITSVIGAFNIDGQDILTENLYSDGKITLTLDKISSWLDVGFGEEDYLYITLTATFVNPLGETETKVTTGTLRRSAMGAPTIEYVTPNVLHKEDGAGSIEIQVSTLSGAEDSLADTIDKYELELKINGTAVTNGTTNPYIYSFDTPENTNIELYSKGSLIDSETIPVIQNGDNAQYYQIDVNHRGVEYSSNGTVRNPQTNIKPIVTFINGPLKGEVSYNQIVNSGYKIYFGTDDEIISEVTSDQFINGISPAEFTEKRVFYLHEASVTPTVDNGYDYTEIDVVSDGKTQIGPVIYPAGEYESGTTYTGNAQKAPYVYVKGTSSNEYYIAFGTPTSAPDSTALDSNVELNGNEPTNQWVKLPSYNAIYADIGVFNHALVGQFVFHKNYMFSQDGKDASGVAGKYSGFNDPAQAIIDGEFIPNAGINGVTGETGFNKIVMNNYTTDGTRSGTTELSLDEVVEDVIGTKLVEGSLGTVPTKGVFDKKWFLASDVQNLREVLIPTIQREVGNLYTEGTDLSIAGEEVSLSSGTNVTITAAYNCCTNKAGAIGINEGYSSSPSLYAPVDTLLTLIDDYFYDGAGTYFPIYIGGADNSTIVDPVSNQSVTDKSGSTVTTVALKKLLFGFIGDDGFKDTIQTLEEFVAGQRKSQITGGLNYLKNVYKDTITTVSNGSIETGVVLAGTMAVTDTITVDGTTGTAIVAGIHNGSDVLQGSEGSGLMIFAGAEGVETVNDTYTQVNNATTEIYSDGTIIVDSPNANGKIVIGNDGLQYFDADDSDNPIINFGGSCSTGPAMMIAARGNVIDTGYCYDAALYVQADGTAILANGDVRISGGLRVGGDLNADKILCGEAVIENNSIAISTVTADSVDSTDVTATDVTATIINADCVVRPTRTVSSNVTLRSTDYHVLVNSSNLTLTLPSIAASSGQVMEFLIECRYGGTTIQSSSSNIYNIKTGASTNKISHDSRWVFRLLYTSTGGSYIPIIVI